MPVAYSKNKGSHTVASTGINKSLHCCLKLSQRHSNISRVLTAKSAWVNYRGLPKRHPSGNHFQSKSIAPDFVNILSTKCRLSLCSPYVLGEDSVKRKSRRRKQESKSSSWSKGSFPLHASLANNSTEPVIISPSSVHVCFACDHFKYARVHKSTCITA